MPHDFCGGIWGCGELAAFQLCGYFLLSSNHFRIFCPLIQHAALSPVFYQFLCFRFIDGVLALHLFFIYHSRKQIQLQNAKLHTGIVLDFPLKGLCELGEALIGHHVKDVDVFVFHPFTVLVHAQTQATTYLLSAGKGRLLLDQSADLEYIGVVPAFLQCGVGEDKAQRTGKAQQPFLVTHDGIIGIIICRCVALGVLQSALFVLREVAIVCFGNIRREPLSNWCVLRTGDQLQVAFLKHFGIDTGRSVLQPIVGDFIDEEQRQDFDTLVSIAKLLVQVCLYSAADLCLLYHVLVDIADRFAQIYFFGVAEFDVLVFRGAINTGNGVSLVKLSFTG